MPLVDFGSFENVYSARIASDGTVTSMSSEDWISSVADDGTGLYTINFKSGLFSVAPAVIYTMGENHATVVHSVVSASSVNAIVRNTSMGTVDSAFVIAVQRQGSDYRQPPQPTAAVIKPAVAILKNVLAYNVNGDATTTGSFNKIPLNTVQGESWFVTLNDSTDVFTLQPGTYEIDAVQPLVKANRAVVVIYDEDNANYPIIGTSNYFDSTNVVAGESSLRGTISITTSTQFSFRYRVSNPHGTGLGEAQGFVSGVNSVYGQVRIRKLK